ncbi:cytosine permease [Salmonella enterica]|nr:cytosine permease [Salmonella enterica]HCL5373380.1 cytosine permease [Salmonella enterica]
MRPLSPIPTWAASIKSAFPNASYRKVVIALGVYAALIVVWGKIIEFFGAMISVAAYVYGPVMALLFIDYFFVRNRKLDLRSAYEIEGHSAYVYSGGYNYVGFGCLILGVLSGLAVFDPIQMVTSIRIQRRRPFELTIWESEYIETPNIQNEVK